MTRRISRRTALGAMAGTLAALRAPAIFAAEEKLRVGKAVVENIGFLPLNIGMEAGIFQRNGLAIEELTFAGGAKIAQAMAADAVDVSLSGGPDMAYAAKGAPEIAVGSISESPSFMAFCVGTQSTAKTMDDLKGKRLGITSAGSLTDWLVDELNRVKGWTGDDRAVKVTVGGATSSELAALKTGQVDATIVSRQVGFLVEEQQVGRFLFDASAYVGPIEMNTIFVHTTLAEKNPDAVRRFLKAWYETIAYMKAHKDETVAIGAKVMGDPPIVVSRAYDTLIANFSNDGKFAPAALETLRTSFVALKSVDGPIDMSRLYTEKYLPGAA